MSPTETMKEELCSLLHHGTGMIEKKDILAKIDELLLKDGYNEDLALIRQAVESRYECYTFEELLKIIINVERDMVDHGDTP
jgi:hypothetical protein